MGGADYESYSNVLTAAYGLFAHTNPLHPDVFPSGQRFEKEVVAMGASLFGGDDRVCGNVTTGGTESILMAVKTARDYARAIKGITQPELLVSSPLFALSLRIEVE
jgi:sphinganine-1-phosphate aldolase